MRPPSFYSDPHVQFLSQLLDELSAGHIQVPRFQRPMVWQWERRRELLRSIRDGIPIGAIMVWRSTNTEVECYRRLGSHRLAKPPEGVTYQYLLDGVQRLSTLFGALRMPEQIISPEPSELEQEALEAEDVEEDDELLHEQDYNVFVDLTTKDFLSVEIDDITDSMMPLNLVLNSVALLRFQRGLSGDDVEKKVAASDEIARAFREYKIPIIPITTDDVDMATRTFQRINSQGARMSETHMVHALTWSNTFDLQRRIRELKKQYLSPIGWESLDNETFLKVCKVVFHLDVYRTNAQELSDKLRAQSERLDEVAKAIRGAAEFLKAACGVPAPDMVPYSLQVVLLAEAFGIQPEPTEELRRLLFAWFWLSTYGEVFAGMSGDRLQNAVNNMEMMADIGIGFWSWKEPFKARPLSNTFDFRSARIKAMVFRLADQVNRFRGGTAGTQILVDAGRKAITQGIPWNRASRHVYSSPANRFLLHPSEVSEFREKLLLGSIDAETAKIHFLTEDAQYAMRIGDLDKFVESRLKAIDFVEQHFISNLAAEFEDVSF